MLKTIPTKIIVITEELHHRFQMTLHRNKCGKSKMMKTISSEVSKMNDVKFEGEIQCGPLDYSTFWCLVTK